MKIIDPVLQREELERKMPFIKKYFEGKVFRNGQMDILQITRIKLFVNGILVDYLGSSDISGIAKECEVRLKQYFNVDVTMFWRGKLW